jgi:hypothetical protein
MVGCLALRAAFRRLPRAAFRAGGRVLRGYTFCLVAFRFMTVMRLFLVGQIFLAGCGATPVDAGGKAPEAESVRLLAKWKTPAEGGPKDRARAQKELEKRFPSIKAWQSFSHIPDVIVIELKPGTDPEVVAKWPKELWQTGFFHYVEPDGMFHAFPTR